MKIQAPQTPLAQQPSTAGAVLLPGVPTLGFGIERYVAGGGAATVISLDPGDGLTVRDREGRQAAEIAAAGVPVVVAVSCDPGTFMRDARILVEGGYRLTRLRPVDQFLWSPHLELAARFDFAG